MFHIPSVLLPQFVSTNIESPHQKCKRANSWSWIEEGSDYLSQFQAKAEMVTFSTRLAVQPLPLHPKILTPNPKPCVRRSLIYGQIMLVNKIHYSYLHVESGVVCP